MHYIFYGSDRFSIKQKLNAWRERFLKIDPSGINLIEIDGESTNYSELENAFNSLPFLSKTRLVIVKNLLTGHKDKILLSEVANLLPKMLATTVAVFIEFGEPDKRSKLFKTLNEPKISFYFPSPTPNKINRFVGQKLRENDVVLDRETVRLLESLLGSDLERIDNELEKIILFYKSNDQKITAGDIDKLVTFETNPNIFHFVESIAAGELSNALKLLSQLIDNGQNEIYLLTMITYQFRTTMTVFDLNESGHKASEITQKTKLHPYVVKKNLAIAKEYTREKLIKIYNLLGRSDFMMKTGQIEPKLGLTKLIYSIASISQ